MAYTVAKPGETFLNAPVIPLDALRWQEIGSGGNPRARLLTTIQIGDLSMHLEAIEVTRDDDGVNLAVDSCREDDLATLESMEDTSFTTLDINGRVYVLYATPYGN